VIGTKNTMGQVTQKGFEKNLGWNLFLNLEANANAAEKVNMRF